MSHTLVLAACHALLFDLDGVLVDSTVCVEHTWRHWSAQHALDADAVIAMSHGRRGAETIRELMPHFDDAQIAAEMAALIAREAHETAGVYEVPGAAALVASIPVGRWAVVTSGVRAVAEHRLRHVGLPIPPAMICADEITLGKPHPMGYLKAAELLGVSPDACIVVEDAPAGVAAARAAGMRVIAVTTTHAADALRDATVITSALQRIAVVRTASEIDTVLQVTVDDQGTR